jgi:TfoX/Sxy family transcriptional regulator of competence genes
VPYDRELADRLRLSLGGEPGVSEKAMFGGLAFLVHGNMAVAASSDGGLMVRVEPGETEWLLQEPGARRFSMRGREMDGWLLVEAAVLEDDGALRSWIDRGVAYARSLPPK